METHDLIILGGGAGAFAAAIKANELGARTLMVNHGLPLGGTCVNVGCVPSKNLIEAGVLLYHSQHRGFGGIKLRQESFDFGKTIQEELDLVAELRHEKYEQVLEGLEHVKLLEGKARFVAPNEIEVDDQRYRAKQFVIATGSTVTAPPIKGLKETGFLTHIEALANKRQPKSLVVIGAGPTALELGQLFHHFGTKVTILNRGKSLVPESEPQVGAALADYLTDEGVALYHEANVLEVGKVGKAKTLTVDIGGKKRELKADEILVATGKSPNTKALNLQAAGVATDGRGAVTVDDHQQTSAEHVFAVGDVTDQKLRLETTAGREGTIAAENALSGTKRKLDYQQVPYAIFTTPAVAGVGMTEAELLASGEQCSCRTIEFTNVPKAHVIKDTRGVIKVVVRKRDQRIFGVHLVAPGAADLINQAMYVIQAKMTVNDVAESLPVFPTLSEALKIGSMAFSRDVSKLSCCT